MANWFLFTLIVVGSLGISGCGEIGVPVESSSLTSLNKIGCEQASAPVSSQKVSRVAIPKINFNSQGNSSASQKLIAIEAQAGELFYFAWEKSCLRSGKNGLNDLKVFGDVEVFDPNGKYIFGRLKLQNAELYSQLANYWSGLDCLKTIETHKVFSKAQSADTFFSQQVDLEVTNYNFAFSRINRKIQSISPIRVAVIDSGIDLDHPDIASQIWINPNEVSGDGIDNDGNGFVDDVNGYNFVFNNGDPDPDSLDPVDNQHGTAVAGMIGAPINGIGVVGVLPVGIQIMSLNVFADEEFATPEDIAAAVGYAQAMGAKVINMSLAGAGDSSVLRAAIEEAVSSGVTVVTAAGNFYSEITSQEEFTPGSYGSSIAGVINVGAINTSDLSMALYSNFSPGFVEIAAPGSQTFGANSRRGLTTLSHDGGYGEMLGTSFAAPLVAGAAALYSALYELDNGSYPSAAMVEQKILSSATPYQHLSEKVQGCRTLNFQNLTSEFQ